MDFIVAFITGLTTGGLSCLAVQGGLLASSLGNQIEKDLQATALQKKGKKKKTAPVPKKLYLPEFALPILIFLVAKILAYTLMGFILGTLGSMFQLSPITRA